MGIVASGHRRGQRGRIRVDLLSRALLGHGHEETVLVGSVEELEGNAGENLVLEQALGHALRRLGQLEGELLEKGRAELELYPRNSGKRFRGVVSLGRRQL